MEKKKTKMILFLISIGLIFLLIFNLHSIKVEKQVQKKIENFIHFQDSKKKEESFLGVLEIPKIKLKQGFYAFDSENNTVNKNIEVIETSLMPNNENSNLILASHSGNSKISYFRNLDKLSLEDIAYIYFNEKKYTYRLTYMYSESKDGTILIRRPSNQTNLTLITCDKNNTTLQNVYIFKLVND